MEANENYSFIVIGKTGAGKSSILNSLVGEIKFPEGEGLKSKTKEVCEYHGKLKYDSANYSIIDTPGFYDSEQEDNKHINNIVKFFKNLKEIGGINCIFYVISLKEQKFDHTLQTCLSLLKTLLGDDVFKMIKIIYTFKNDLSNKAYVKAIDRFKDLPQLLVTSGFPVSENLETFIFDYDEPEEFCKQILESTKNSPKLFPEVLNHLERVDFDLTDPVKVYRSLIENSQCISSLNDQLNQLKEVIANYERQCYKFEEEKKIFSQEIKRKEEEIKKLLVEQKSASEANKHEINEMIKSYSSQLSSLNQRHVDNLNEMRKANELENRKIMEAQEKWRIEQDQLRIQNENKLREENNQNMNRLEQQINTLRSENQNLRNRPPVIQHVSRPRKFCTIY